MASIAGTGGAGGKNIFDAKIKPNTVATPQAKPAGPTGQRTVKNQGPTRLGVRGSRPTKRTVITHAPKGPTEADLTFQNQVNAIGPKAVQAASHPGVAITQAVLGDLTGIPAVVSDIRKHDVIGAGVNAAALFPFGRPGRIAKAAEDTVKAVEGAEDVARVAPKVSYTTKGVPRTVKGQPTLGPKTLPQTATEALQGAKQTRTAQEALRSTERAKRIKEYTKASQVNPTAAGHREASRLLAGKYPKLDWANFQNFSPETIDQLHKYIVEHPDLQGFEVKRARDAIDKAYAGIAPQKNEEKLLRKAFGVPATNQIMRSVSKYHQIKSLVYDVGNIPRSVMASYDVSGILRQALLVGTGHPVIWGKNVPSYLKALKSEDFYNIGMQALHNRPNALSGVYDKMGVDLTELTPRGGDTAAREESFRSPLAEKIPGVRMSGRGFTLFLDQARADLADHLYLKAQAAGKADNEHTLQSIGDVVNSMSGRGDLGEGPIGRSQEGLNLLLFSPRLIKSRVDFLNPLWYRGLDPIARHQAYRAMGGLVVFMTTALEIAHVAGAQVDLNPRSSDFAKIKIGNTRIDLAGGFQQYMHLLGEIATQQKTTSSGKTIKLGPEGPGKTSDWDVLFSFLRAKLAPVASAGVDISQRRNTVGQPLTVSNSVLSRFTPLSGQDAVSVGQDAARHHGALAGVGAGTLAGLLSAFGGGVQNYQAKKPKTKVTNPFNAPAPTKSTGSNIFDQKSSSSKSKNVFGP